jgi:hypothetical protein
VFVETLEFVLGAAIVWIALRDVFDTVVVSGEASGPLKIARRLAAVALPVRRRLMGGGVGLGFAPLLLLGTFFVWMMMLVLGFGLMTHAVKDEFNPPADGFGEALYLAGTALTTVGFGNSQPTGLASAIGVLGGFCGLAVVTMAVTYLLQVQSNISKRDALVLMLTTTAGEPPSAVALLERYSALGAREELAGELRRARDWCATVLQSHASHPSLIYFRSAGVGSGWPATLGTVIDLALLIECVVAAPDLRGLAVLAREEGEGLARELTQLLNLTPINVATTREELAATEKRLEDAGYDLQASDMEAFAFARSKRACCIQALADHLGLRSTCLIPPADAGG